MVKVRLVQVKSEVAEPVDVRIDRVLAELPSHLSNADFVVLPELWTIHAFNLEALQSNAMTLSDDFFQKLAEIIKNANKWLHAGTFPIKHADGSVTNTAIVFNSDGEKQIIYSKIHLFGFQDGERKYLSAGNKIAISKTPLGETGISTCYDLRFPELFQEQNKRGATSFIVSAGWPTIRSEHWETLLKARAIENQSYVVAACGRGTFNKIELAGKSMVIDPTGNVLARGNKDDEFVDGEIDLELVKKWRADFPVLNDRRDLHNL